MLYYIYRMTLNVFHNPVLVVRKRQNYAMLYAPLLWASFHIFKICKPLMVYCFNIYIWRNITPRRKVV